jgi:hypothetical protein
MRCISHCMVMTGSIGTTLIMMMSMMIRLQIYFNCFSLGVNYDSKFVVIHSFSVFGEKRNGEIAIP